MRLFALAASLRRDSWNRKLIQVAVDLARRHGAEVDHADFREFDMPLYDADLQAAQGLPPGAQELGRRIAAAQGLLLASPEYNYSIPGPLKNAIDWVSRARPMPLRGRSALLLATSNGQFGGVRGLLQLRLVLEGLGVHVYPDMFPLPQAAQQFDDTGGLRDPERLARLEKLIEGYLPVARALAQAAGDGG
ncbi:MAG TPA: NAD(P)H-dependent oxidoreductase [Gemmatimonadales bacterium]|jgi:NAD(P)H-dependent FMN reductase|nr:NAD(P)H-dependent oxidoreductase [Gemmatimonadales bacterium]